MFTINYKGFYIHGYIYKPECSVVFYHYSKPTTVYKSLHAAKIAITKFLKEIT